MSTNNTDKSPLPTLTLDGAEVAFTPGETLYELAERHRSDIPTLCYDPRLEPLGACRLCVVELEGARNPVASCTTVAQAGMVVRTATPTIERHRQVLLELVASENRDIDVDPLSGYAANEAAGLIDRYQARTGRFKGATSGHSRPDDPNPFIARDYDNCISCYRCVRVCAEREGDYAISVAGRGFHTQITTEFAGHLADSACTFCGQCVQTCPTGALGDKKALRFATATNAAAQPAAAKAAEAAAPAPQAPASLAAAGVTKTRTVCAYCGVGCSVDILSKDDRVVGIQPAMDGPANQGALCVMGQFAYDFVHHPDRLTTPLIRDDSGAHRPASWDEALDHAAAKLREVTDTHGRHSIYGVASGRAPTEASYMMQRFIRAGFGTSYIDNCSRA